MTRASLGPRLGALGVGIVLGLLVLEAGLRLTGPTRDAADLRSIHTLRPDRPWLYGMRPGSAAVLPGGVRYEVNAHGFRDGERSLAPPADGFRIAVVGDSVAFGWGVAREAAFPARLEARLHTAAARAQGPPVEVLNFGVGGYNAFTESELLRDVVLDFAPDLVLVQFCINDLSDPTAHFGTHARQRLGTLPAAAFPDPAMRGAATAALPALERGCARSALCARLRDLYWEHLAPPIARERHRAAGQGIARPEGPAWAWLEARYVEMATAAKEAGAGFAVFWFPHIGHLRPELADPVYDALLRLSKRHGWPTIDARAAFGEARARGALFLDYWHPSPLGHDLAAREAVAQLVCTGALPERVGLRCRRARDRARHGTAGPHS